MNKNTMIIGLVVLAVVVVGGYFLLTADTTQPLTENETSTQPTENENTTPTEQGPATYEIIYTDAGYSPSPLTIKVGDTVTFKNQSSHTVWTASAMHPSHMVYSGTDLETHCPDAQNTSFDQCQAAGPGTSWFFTFTKAGTWGYHDHVNAGKFGQIIVQ